MNRQDERLHESTLFYISIVDSSYQYKSGGKTTNAPGHKMHSSLTKRQEHLAPVAT